MLQVDHRLVSVDLQVKQFHHAPQIRQILLPRRFGLVRRVQRHAGDGDPLDALVFTREALHPGTLVRFRPIGVLRMRDGGDADEKIIGVPTDKLDPTYSAIRDIGDLPAIERQRIEAFFRIYKDLPEGRKTVELGGFGNAEEARKLIADALARFGEAQRDNAAK